MRRRWSPAAVALGGLLGLAPMVRAHDVRPGYLEVRQVDAQVFEVAWKIPTRTEGDQALTLPLQPRFPADCVAISSADVLPMPGAILQRWRMRCPQGLRGEIGIDGLEATLTDVLFRFEPLDGAPRTSMLRPAAPNVRLGTGDGPSAAAGTRGGPGATFVSYLSLGVEHILRGADHLLFLLGLVLLVRDRLSLIKTITAFTAAHSITLALATLGLARAPLPPLHAAIALSILFLGPEIVRSWRGESSFTLRHPWVVAFVFGLLHGFGFATGLSTLGMPAAEVPVALLSFNVGVELGQLVFVLMILALERSFRVLEIAWPRWMARLPGYTVGALGAYWTLQRVFLLWRPA